MVVADARTVMVFALSPGHDDDTPHGRSLMQELGPMPEGLPMLMDRQLMPDPGMIPVVLPKFNRPHPWDYDHAIYKKRNKIERLFHRLKDFCRIFSCFEKLHVLFLAFLLFAFIVEALCMVRIGPLD